MNIAAVMAALEIDDLDHMAKVSVVVVACRAHRHSGRAVLSTGRVARDMKANYTTASRALARAVEAKYLSVDKPSGLVPTWRLTSRLVHDPTSRPDALDLVTNARGGSDLFTTKDSLEKIKEGVARHPANRRPVDESNTTYAHLADWTGSYQARIDAERNGLT